MDEQEMQSDADKRFAEEVRRLEGLGYKFENANASLQLLRDKLEGRHKPAFEPLHYTAISRKVGDEPSVTRADVKIRVDDEEEITAAEGGGPVGALDKALRKALWKFYSLSGIRFIDYRFLLIPNGHIDTDSKVRVHVFMSDQNFLCAAVGVSSDVVEASWLALVDIYQYILGNRIERR